MTRGTWHPPNGIPNPKGRPSRKIEHDIDELISDLVHEPEKLTDDELEECTFEIAYLKRLLVAEINRRIIQITEEEFD